MLGKIAPIPSWIKAQLTDGSEGWLPARFLEIVGELAIVAYDPPPTVEPTATWVPPTATWVPPTATWEPIVEPIATWVEPTQAPTNGYTGYYDPFGPYRNCGDFSTHAEAQDFYYAAGGPTRDPHRLDRDKDGSACESLP